MYSTAVHVAQHHLQPPVENGSYRVHPTIIVQDPTVAQNHQRQQQQPAQTMQPRPPQDPKERVVVSAIPSMTIQGDRMLVGNAQSSSVRSYTPLKVIGDGSFGTVWLCDWHSPLPPGTSLSPMQCGAGARPEWAGKRLVALKRMKKKWEGGWDDCKKLKELESLRLIPPHENIIPLYDYFLLPTTKELYFVFESMEGNLYQLIKSRKTRPLAGGLTASIFYQVVSGLHHIHESGYFHRDMKPENLLVTTTGLADYQPTSPIARLGAPPEKDVMVIVKLADFGLARETRSKPPYTEYVSTRWYRAPEVLLRSKDYSNPVDMWALGTILAELINLKPLFPGQGEIDQVQRITQVLGDPSDEYGVDDRGRVVGGGKWSRGLKMAKLVGFTFARVQPIEFRSLFAQSVPLSLIDCIADLLRYDPEARLTTRQCLDHPYVHETRLRTIIPTTPQPVFPPPGRATRPTASTSLPSIPPRSVPPSHSHSPSHGKIPFNAPGMPEASTSHRAPFYPQSHSQPQSASVDTDMVDAVHRPPIGPELLDRLRELDHAHADLASFGRRPPPSPVPSSVYTFGGDRVANTWQRDANAMAVDAPSPAYGYAYSDVNMVHDEDMDEEAVSPTAIELPQVLPEPEPEPEPNGQTVHTRDKPGFWKRNKVNKPWNIFSNGHSISDKVGALSPVDELHVAITPSLKRPQSGSGSTSDSHSLPELPPLQPALVRQSSVPAQDPKKMKKEIEKMHRESEKARRLQLEMRLRDQARAVTLKRKEIMRRNEGTDISWMQSHLEDDQSKKKPKEPPAPQPPPPQPQPRATNNDMLTVPSLNGSKSIMSFGQSTVREVARGVDPVTHRYSDDGVEHRTKARRRQIDDDHSSSDVHSIAHMSVMSFASVDSDPGPHRSRRKGPATDSTLVSSSSSSAYGINRTASVSSLRSSTDFSSVGPSARSSHSLEGQYLADFMARTTFDSGGTSCSSPILASPPVSPPPMHALTLSPTHWSDGSSPSPISPGPPAQSRPIPAAFAPLLPGIASIQAHNGSASPFAASSPGGLHRPSSGEPPSAINPMFQVTPFAIPVDPGMQSVLPLPPFSHLASVAEGQHQPPSPLQQHLQHPSSSSSHLPDS